MITSSSTVHQWDKKKKKTFYAESQTMNLNFMIIIKIKFWKILLTETLKTAYLFDSISTKSKKIPSSGKPFGPSEQKKKKKALALLCF